MGGQESSQGTAEAQLRHSASYSENRSPSSLSGPDRTHGHDVAMPPEEVPVCAQGHPALYMVPANNANHKTPSSPGFFSVCCYDPMGRKFGAFLFLLIVFFFIEVVCGVLTGSVALLSDALHMLSDILAIIMAIFAIAISQRSEDATYTYGFTRASVVAGIINGVFLVSVTIMMFFEVAGKFVHRDELKELDGQGHQILIVGSAGLAVNLLGICILGEAGHNHGPGGHDHGHSHGHGGSQDQQASFTSDAHGHNHGLGHDHGHGQGHGAIQYQQDSFTGQAHQHSRGHAHNTGHSHGLSHGHSHHPAHIHSAVQYGHGHDDGKDTDGHENLNASAALLHVMGDTLGSVVVVVVALILIYAEGDWKYFADPVLTLIILCIILASAIPLVRKCIIILLQAVPSDIDLKELQTHLTRCSPSVVNIHDLHLWTAEPGCIVGSLHAVLAPTGDCKRVISVMKTVLHQYGVHSCAIQVEQHEADGSCCPTRKCNETMCLLPCMPGCQDERTCCKQRRHKSINWRTQSTNYGRSAV